MTRPYPVYGLVFVAFVVLGAVVLSGTAVAQDQFEPNDDIGTATEVTDGEYTGLTVETGESDFFAVEVAPGEGLNATLRGSTASDLDMRMYAPNQSQIGSSTSFSGTEALAVASEQGGTYSVEVYGFGGESGPYSLSLTTGEDIETNLNPGFGSGPTPGTGPSLESDQFEPNDNFGTATEVSGGEYTDLTIQDGESDYFAVEMSQDQTLTAEIGFNNSQGDLDMRARGPGETERDNSVSAFSNSESVSLTANQSDTHYVEVYGFARESAEYSLNLSKTSDPSGDDNPDSSDGGDGTDSNDSSNGTNGESSGGDSSGPGFGLLAALLGLGGAGYLVRRRN